MIHRRSISLAKRGAVQAVLAAAILALAGCVNPLESVGPFNTGDVPVEAAQYDCTPPQGKQPPDIKAEVAVIAAPTDTFVRFSNVISASEGDLREFLNRDGTQVTTVLADGQPIQTTKSWVDFSKVVFQADKDKAINRAIGKVRMTYYCAVMVKEQNDSVHKPVPGADFLSALQVASSSFDSESDDRKIIVLGNGLQDVGQLDLTKGLPQDVSSARSIVETLDNAGALPDLTGVEVYWYGLGQNDRVKQQPLHPIAAKALESLWAELIKAAGGQLVKVVKNIPYADPVETSIQANVIDVPEPPCVFMLTSDDGFNFKPDSAEFLNQQKAMRGAESMAGEIKRSDCSGPLYVVGYAASGVDKDQYTSSAIAKVKSLSSARAIAFKNLLESAGVEIKLVPVGAGKGPSVDWDSSGKFLEDLAKLNRFVEVTQVKPEVD